MSAHETGIKAVHLWGATCLVLAGMGSMVWVGGRWQGEVNVQLRTMTEQMTGMRADVKTVAEQVQKNRETNAVQDTKLDQLLEERTRIYVPPGRIFDK